MRRTLRLAILVVDEGTRDWRNENRAHFNTRRASCVPGKSDRPPAGDSQLLVTQGLDGIERRSTICGVKSEPDPDSRANDEAGNGPAIGENYVNLQPKREQIAPNHTQNNAENSTRLGNEYRLSEELSEDIATACADRFANANLLRAFRHAHEHDVHDANTGSNQGDETDHECANADHAGNIEKSAFERVVSVDLKIVFLICLQAAGDSHRADSFIQRPVVEFGRKRLRGDVHRPVGYAVILKKPGDRHEKKIVLAFPKGGPLFCENTNNAISVAAHADDLADGRLVWKQTFLDALADNGDVAGKGHIFFVKVAAVTEGECIGGKKTSIRSDNRETWRCLNPVINGLAFQVAPEALQANLRRVSLHQFVITLRLLIGDVAAVLVFFLHIGTAGVDVHRIFRELKDIRSKKTGPALDGILQRANRCHDQNDREHANGDADHR